MHVLNTFYRDVANLQSSASTVQEHTEIVKSTSIVAGLLNASSVEGCSEARALLNAVAKRT